MLEIPQGASIYTVIAMLLAIVVAVWQAARKRKERADDEEAKLEKAVNDALASGNGLAFGAAARRLRDWQKKHGR